MSFNSYALPEFWERYDALPADIKDLAAKQYSLFRVNPRHPSLRFKQKGRLWSARITRGYRALALRRGQDLFWFWIGSHDEYQHLIRS